MFQPAVTAPAAAPAPPPGRAHLQMHTDPEGATMLVVPAVGGKPGFQCVTPCGVWIPYNWGFSLYPVKSGYKAVTPYPEVKWVRAGVFKSDLSTHDVTIKLEPVAPTGNP